MIKRKLNDEQYEKCVRIINPLRVPVADIQIHQCRICHRTLPEKYLNVETDEQDMYKHLAMEFHLWSSHIDEVEYRTGIPYSPIT